MIITAKVDSHVRHPAQVPEAPYPPSLALVVPSTDKAAGWLQEDAALCRSVVVQCRRSPHNLDDQSYSGS